LKKHNPNFLNLLEQLKSLYKDGFPKDKEEFVEHFFSDIKKGNIFCIEEKGELLGAGYIKYKNARLLSEKQKVPYLVAISTNSQHRNKGISKLVISGLFYKLYDRGEAFCFLNPFDSNFYKKFGFTDVSFCCNEILNGNKNIELKVYSTITEPLIAQVVKLHNKSVKNFSNKQILTKSDLNKKVAEFNAEKCSFATIENCSGKAMSAFCIFNDTELLYYITDDIELLKNCFKLQGLKFTNLFCGSTPYIQARIVSVMAALEKSVLLKDSFVIKVTDSIIEENNKVLEVLKCKESRGNRNEVRVSDKRCDIEVDISALTSLILVGDGVNFKKQTNYFLDMY